MPRTTLSGEANLLVLPDIDSANIAYNLLKHSRRRWHRHRARCCWAPPSRCTS